MEKRVTRSNSNTRRDPEETEGAFWGRVIDPVTIEKGQAGSNQDGTTCYIWGSYSLTKYDTE